MLHILSTAKWTEDGREDGGSTTDSIIILIGLFVIGVWLEVFAVRRDKALIEAIKRLEDHLEDVVWQTDTHYNEKVALMKNDLIK